MSKVVLVVDDDEGVREGIAELLLENGFSVQLARDGLEALAVLRQHKTCVVLLDLMMPVMDGADFRRAQLADRDLSHIPFILMTGRLSCAGYGKAMGAVACLRKPFAPTDLIEAVQQSGCCS
jgi:CheY-like chemotaxis protein